MTTHRTISHCPCGHRACEDWHVEPEAWVQGVKFTQPQARAVKLVLDFLDQYGRVRSTLPHVTTNELVNELINLALNHGEVNR